MYTVTMDGKTYRLRVRYNTMERAFELRSGDNEGYMLSGRHERDLLGTGYSYQFSVEPDPQHPQEITHSPQDNYRKDIRSHMFERRLD